VSEGSTAQKFDRYAEDYDALCGESIRTSGESAAYFHRYKLGCLQRLGLGRDARLLDFGCGTGTLTACLSEYYGEVHGYDPSAVSIERASARAPRAKLHAELEGVPDAHFSAVVLAGVLHHVLPAERPALLGDVRAKLAPGGRLVVFEHNPYNPLTRRAVDACPFDDDAILVPPALLRRLLKGAGFSDVRQDYIVFFPRFLAPLRPLEPYLRRFFLGAQTMTVGVKGCA
jgi:SAM-dependent methyltransferase